MKWYNQEGEVLGIGSRDGRGGVVVGVAEKDGSKKYSP